MELYEDEYSKEECNNRWFCEGLLVMLRKVSYGKVFNEQMTKQLIRKTQKAIKQRLRSFLFTWYHARLQGEDNSVQGNASVCRVASHTLHQYDKHVVRGYSDLPRLPHVSRWSHEVPHFFQGVATLKIHKQSSSKASTLRQIFLSSSPHVKLKLYIHLRKE